MTDKKLKIWLVEEGEALPTDSNSRLMRTGILAKYLASEGHEVTWWSSSFIHGSKSYYCNEYKEIEVQENERLILLHSPIAYKKNVSFERIVYHILLAKQMKEKIETKEVPDIIVCCYPTVQFAEVCSQYAKKHNIPIIMDVRDLWPDIFDRALPEKIRGLACIPLFPMKCHTSRVLKRATAITGVVPYGVMWGLKYAKRKKTKLDEPVYIGYLKPFLTNDQMQEAFDTWEKKGATKDTWNLCFIGTISNSSLDLMTVVEAVLKLDERYSDVRLIIGGAGDGAEEIKKRVGEDKRVVLGGWLGGKEMTALMQMSKAGLYCYKNTIDFTNAFGNKIIQYMSEGLPVISSLKGFSKDYIEEYEMGTVYSEGDVQSCMEAIMRMHDSEVERAEMGTNAKLRFDKDFEFEVVNKRFEEYILTVYDAEGKKNV